MRSRSPRIETALAPYKAGIRQDNHACLVIPLLRCFFMLPQPLCTMTGSPFHGLTAAERTFYVYSRLAERHSQISVISEFLIFLKFKNSKEITKMAFYYAQEKKKFDGQWEWLQNEYMAAGMSLEDIEAMQKFDLEAFNSNRRFFNHQQKSQDQSWRTAEILCGEQPPCNHRCRYLRPSSGRTRPAIQ